MTMTIGGGGVDSTIEAVTMGAGGGGGGWRRRLECC